MVVPTGVHSNHLSNYSGRNRLKPPNINHSNFSTGHIIYYSFQLCPSIKSGLHLLMQNYAAAYSLYLRK